MSDHLATYLHDHLAGARFAIDLLERLRDSYDNERLGQFAKDLLGKIEEDHAILRQLAEEVGGRDSLKEATAWLAEKTARLKFRLGNDADFSVFESFEALSLGILGKRALWRALEVLAPMDSRVRRLDLAKLAARAESQYQEVEALRLQFASTALLSTERS